MAVRGVANTKMTAASEQHLKRDISLGSVGAGVAARSVRRSHGSVMYPYTHVNRDG